MRITKNILVISMAAALFCACNSGSKDSDNSEGKQKIIKKYRDDGTMLSATQVNKEKYAHGVKVNYYSDGKTVHSRVSYDNGRKDGPAIWYYKNGQIFEHTGFKNNLREGLTKKYYKSGALMAEYTYEKDQVMPGLKEFTEEGGLITGYPEVSIREINKLKTENKIILEISATNNGKNAKYYQLIKLNDSQFDRSYLKSDNGICRLEYYVHPGNVLNKTIEFFAEIPTDLGNQYIIKKSYNLNVMNI